jgi:nucleotide-binding universal stress UspA family protein
MPVSAAPVAASLRTVLCPTDLSIQSERALEHALLLARRFAARLTLYHAVKAAAHGHPQWRFGQPADGWSEAETAACAMLVERAGRLDVAHQTVVERAASVPHAILARIKTMQPDVTVMATHGRTGLPHLFLGSVLETVIRRAFRPILAIPPVAMGEPARPYTRIVLPIDFSRASRLAFPLAAELARAFDTSSNVGVPRHHRCSGAALGRTRAGAG